MRQNSLISQVVDKVINNLVQDIDNVVHGATPSTSELAVKPQPPKTEEVTIIREQTITNQRVERAIAKDKLKKPRRTPPIRERLP